MDPCKRTLSHVQKSATQADLDKMSNMDVFNPASKYMS